MTRPSDRNISTDTSRTVNNVVSNPSQPVVVTVPTTRGDKQGVVVFSKKATYKKPWFFN